MGVLRREIKSSSIGRSEYKLRLLLEKGNNSVDVFQQTLKGLLLEPQKRNQVGPELGVHVLGIEKSTHVVKLPPHINLFLVVKENLFRLQQLLSQSHQSLSVPVSLQFIELLLLVIKQGAFHRRSAFVHELLVLHFPQKSLVGSRKVFRRFQGYSDQALQNFLFAVLVDHRAVQSVMVQNTLLPKQLVELHKGVSEGVDGGTLRGHIVLERSQANIGELVFQVELALQFNIA